MSTPYPPQPRRLMRDPSRKLIGGVCSGLAKYLNMDVNLVRILTVLISLFTGIPIVLYIIALFVLPEERPEQQPPYVNGPQPNAYGSGFTAEGSSSWSYPPAPGQPVSTQPAYGQPAYGQPTPPPADDVWGAAGAPWEQPQTGAQPAAQQPAGEPTGYDTAPAEPAEPAEPVVRDPEPVAETEVPEPDPADSSDWESAPAEPDNTNSAPSEGTEPKREG